MTNYYYVGSGLAVNLLITIIDKSSPYLQLTAGIVNSASRMAQLPNVLERTTFAAENFMLNTHHQVASTYSTNSNTKLNLNFLLIFCHLYWCYDLNVFEAKFGHNCKGTPPLINNCEDFLNNRAPVGSFGNYCTLLWVTSVRVYIFCSATPINHTKFLTSRGRQRSVEAH